MIKSDTFNLRTETIKAARAGNQARLDRQSANEEARTRKESEDAAAAKLIIREIPKMARERAEEGAVKVRVMIIANGECTPHVGDFRKHTLTGVAKRVHDELVTHKFTPKIGCETKDGEEAVDREDADWVLNIMMSELLDA